MWSKRPHTGRSVEIFVSVQGRPQQRTMGKNVLTVINTLVVADDAYIHGVFSLALLLLLLEFCEVVTVQV